MNIKRTFGAAAFAAVLFTTAALMTACGAGYGTKTMEGISGSESGQQAGTNSSDVHGDGPQIVFVDESHEQDNSAAAAQHNDGTDAGQQDSSTDAGQQDDLTKAGEQDAPEGEQVEARVIVLDPGHGGKHKGAASGSFVEQELALRLAFLIREHLEQYEGVTVLLTREEDKELSSDLVEDLELRAEFARENGAAALVSLHFNGSAEHNANGCVVYVSNRPAVNTECTELAECIIDRLAALGIKRNGVRTRNSNDMKDEQGKPLDYYAINRHCASRGIPGIIVEHCYLDNSADRGFYDSDEALERLALADAEGIAEYLGLGR